jgi:hypothetical protein
MAVLGSCTPANKRSLKGTLVRSESRMLINKGKAHLEVAFWIVPYYMHNYDNQEVKCCAYPLLESDVQYSLWSPFQLRWRSVSGCELVVNYVTPAV